MSEPHSTHSYLVLRENRFEQGFVHCDDLTCQAKQEPSTLEEYKLAYEHWSKHGYLHGCSHGD